MRRETRPDAPPVGMRGVRHQRVPAVSRCRAALRRALDQCPD
jgi:hypothetical protein